MVASLRRSLFEGDAAPLSGAGLTFDPASRLFFYFFEGRNGLLKRGVIDFVSERAGDRQDIRLTTGVLTPGARERENRYAGTVNYWGSQVRFSFSNGQHNLVLYLLPPLEERDNHALLWGMSTSELSPRAFRCLVSPVPYPYSEELKNKLLLRKEHSHRGKVLSIKAIDNVI